MKTPWGDADQLRLRMLPAGRGTPRQVTEDSQRERLYGAMVASCARRGYGETSVADLIALAGVSRRDFYRHFEHKEACFLAALDEILTAAPAIVASRLRREGSAEERAQRAMATLIDLIVEQPAAARLCLVEAYAAGPAATARVDAAIGRFRELAEQALTELAGPDRPPAEIVAGLVGGLVKMIHTRLHRGTEAELLELGPVVLELALSYRPPPRPLRPAPNRPGASLAPEGDRDGEGPAERIARATLVAIARKGYPRTTIREIVEEAGVSFATFYTHFDGKEGAFDYALYGARSRMLAAAFPAYVQAGAAAWPEAVRAASHTVLGFFAAEPEFTRSIAIDVYAAGPRALERRDLGIEAAQRIVDDGAAHGAHLPPLAHEAIISTLYAMFCSRVLAEGPESLPSLAPLAAYTLLCPFLGAEEACAAVNGRPASREPLSP